MLAEHAADGRGGLADPELAADVDAETVEQGALDQHDAIVSPDRPRLLGAGDGDVAIKRIVVVDGLHLDQSALAAFRPRHGAEACRFAQPAERLECRVLFRIGLAVDQLERKVAADERASLTGKRVVERGGERADGSDRGDAKRDAQHENCEPPGTRAELAERDGERQSELR